MRSFAYARPDRLEDVLALLEEHGPRARLLAGGTDLLVGLRMGHILPSLVIDVKNVAELTPDIVEAGSSLRFGALTLMSDIVDDARVRRHFPALVEAASVVGSVQIRNRATLTGNICNASPAADTAPALLVYGAVVNLVSAAGPRSVPLTEFFTGPGTTVLRRGELVQSIDLPLPSEPAGSAFGRVTRRRGVDLASVNLACLVRSSGKVSFAYGAVGPRPFLVEGSSDELERMIAHAAPISDVRASRDYRLAMLPVMSRRALATAMDRLNNSFGSGSQPAAGLPPGAPRFRRGGGSQGPPHTITLTVNGREYSREVPPHRTLLAFLRDDLDLTGTKECCSSGECGSCTVLLDGRAVTSCLVLAVEADGCEVVTIEGLASHGRLDALQTAFLDEGAVQCGFCIPGMIMSARYLLTRTPHPTEPEVREGLAGNLCRCAGYSRIVQAVVTAAGAEE